MALTKKMERELQAMLARVDRRKLAWAISNIFFELYPAGGKDDTGPRGSDFIDAVSRHLDGLGLDPRKLDPGGWNR